MKTKPVVSDRDDGLLGSVFRLSHLSSEFLFRNIDRLANLISTRPDDFEQLLPESCVPEFLQQRPAARRRQRLNRRGLFSLSADPSQEGAERIRRESDAFFNGFIMLSIARDLTYGEKAHIRHALAKSRFSVFHDAAAEGDVERLDALFKLAHKVGGKALVAETLASNDFGMLKAAACNGHACAVRKIADTAKETDNEEILRRMMARHYETLRLIAEENGHHEVRDLLDHLNHECSHYRRDHAEPLSASAAFRQSLHSTAESVAFLAPAFLIAARNFPDTVAMNGLFLRQEVS